MYIFNAFSLDKKNNFRKYERSQIDSLGTPYDYGSVMHYSNKAFSRNGKVTIQVKQRGVCFILRYKITKLVSAL